MALHWYRLAAERGRTDAKKNVARLASGQSPEEIDSFGVRDELYKRATAVYNRGDTDGASLFSNRPRMPAMRTPKPSLPQSMPAQTTSRAK